MNALAQQYDAGKMARVTTAALSGIAIIAAYHVVIASVIAPDADFKPIRADRQLDISRYGWQKRQRSGKKRQEDVATVAGSGNPARFHGREGEHKARWVADGDGEAVEHYAVGKVLRRRMIELLFCSVCGARVACQVRVSGDASGSDALDDLGHVIHDQRVAFAGQMVRWTLGMARAMKDITACPCHISRRDASTVTWMRTTDCPYLL